MILMNAADVVENNQFVQKSKVYVWNLFFLGKFKVLQ